MNKVKDHYKTIVVGGGIVGAGVFRDLCLHGIDTLIIDKKDFLSQTSQSSSKMLHGGIRYLENFDFKLVFEALGEKNLWIKNAPHLCYESPFYIPVYKDSKNPLWMLRLGLIFYDTLSRFQNSPHKILSDRELKSVYPSIKTEGLKGAGMYYDAVVDDVKMGIECISDGLHHHKNSTALPHCSFESFTDEKKVLIKDQLTGEEKEVTFDHIVFATGPFSDQVFKKIPKFNWEPKLLLSKGSHLWLKRDSLEIDSPMVMMTKDERIIFLIPQFDKILVGTTEVVLDQKEQLFDLTPSKGEVDYILNCLKEYFPTQGISKKSILSSFAGIRPLIKEGNSTDSSKTARDHKIFRPSKNTHIVAGGKYTTFRVMACDVVKEITPKFDIEYSPSKSKSPFAVSKTIIPFKENKLGKELIERILSLETPRTFEDLVIRRLRIPSRAHWKKDEDFDEFFIELLPIMSKHFEVDEKIIQEFK